MRMVFGLVLVVGLALAGAAVYMAQGFIGQTTSALEKERELRKKTGNLVEVYVAAKPLNYGDPITKEDVQLVYWPEKSLPEGVFHEEAALFPGESGKPRFVLRQMEKFEPLMVVKVTEPGEPAGLTGQIEKGMRAFAIKVEAADFLQPGDHVDIYWTGSVAGTEGELTRLIEGTMKIIAVDRTDKKSDTDGQILARTMTVAASPEQVARLAQAQATGRLVMSLVGSGDNEAISGLVEVDGNSLLGIEQQTIVEAEAEKVCTIRTRKGSEMVEIEIPCTN